jgi:L,D-transpeptidase catalytic domain
MRTFNFLLIVLFVSLSISCKTDEEGNSTLFGVSLEEDVVPKPALNFEKTKKKAEEALTFCKAKNFNQDFCILIDMSVHSGINRLVVWDFKKDTIDHICLVGHGSGDHPWNNDYTKENPKFSNVENSHCSSLGKYRIGERAPSDWGVKIKYVIHGLEKTNDNAAKRFVVFHSWENVPDEELYPSGTPEGWGCPIVSLSNFRLIDEKLKSNSKSTLMWIYTD